MTKRDNLLRLLRRQGCDEIPFEFALCPSLIESFKLNKHTEDDYMSYFGMPWKRLPDLVPDNTDLSRFLKYFGGEIGADTVIDEWGIGHRSTPTSMHMTQMLYPLANADSVEQIDEYPLPAYSGLNNSALAQQVKELHQRGIASVGNMQCTIWETSWYICGMENLMMNMMSDEPMAEHILDRVTEMSLSRALLYARAGVDILFLGDDVGMQQSLMMSEALYCEWIKPRLSMIIKKVREAAPDIIIFYHSCGYITPLIPHLIEAGIDVLNPIQPECMDFEKIYKTYGGALSFHGTIGTQTTMPFGSPEDVRKEVFRNLKIAGDKGGLFVAPTHLLEPEVPWENIEAYVAACKSYKL